MFTCCSLDKGLCLGRQYVRSIETAFGHMSTALDCEIKPLCYPKAALFCFACALLAYNAFTIVKGAVAAEHGRAESEIAADRQSSCQDGKNKTRINSDGNDND